MAMVELSRTLALALSLRRTKPGTSFQYSSCGIASMPRNSLYL